MKTHLFLQKMRPTGNKATDGIGSGGIQPRLVDTVKGEPTMQVSAVSACSRDNRTLWVLE